jgi:hypothetical protein
MTIAAQKTRQPFDVWFTMVVDSSGMIRRVGRPFYSSKTAKSWLKFVRDANGAHTAVIRKCRIEFDAEGNVKPDVLARLDTEFNCDVTW